MKKTAIGLAGVTSTKTILFYYLDNAFWITPSGDKIKINKEQYVVVVAVTKTCTVDRGFH